MKTINANLFRTFANKSKCALLSNSGLTHVILLDNRNKQSGDPDEDEPNLEEAWPHMQLVYELLLKFIMSPHLTSDVLTGHISNGFIK